MVHYPLLKKVSTKLFVGVTFPVSMKRHNKPAPTGSHKASDIVDNTFNLLMFYDKKGIPI